jgi:hypothetical protein
MLGSPAAAQQPRLPPKRPWSAPNTISSAPVLPMSAPSTPCQEAMALLLQLVRSLDQAGAESLLRVMLCWLTEAV